jgi:hypothetical protein
MYTRQFCTIHESACFVSFEVHVISKKSTVCHYFRPFQVYDTRVTPQLLFLMNCNTSELKNLQTSENVGEQSQTALTYSSGSLQLYYGAMR